MDDFEFKKLVETVLRQHGKRSTAITANGPVKDAIIVYEVPGLVKAAWDLTNNSLSVTKPDKGMIGGYRHILQSHLCGPYDFEFHAEVVDHLQRMAILDQLADG